MEKENKNLVGLKQLNARPPPCFLMLSFLFFPLSTRTFRAKIVYVSSRCAVMAKTHMHLYFFTLKEKSFK